MRLGALDGLFHPPGGRGREQAIAAGAEQHNQRQSGDHHRDDHFKQSEPIGAPAHCARSRFGHFIWFPAT